MVNLETAIVNLIRQIKDRNTKKGNVIIHRNTILIHLVTRLAVNSIKLQNNNYTYKKNISRITLVSAAKSKLL